MKYISLVIMTLGVVACGSDEGAGVANPSGTFVLTQVECYSSLGSVTKVGAIPAGTSEFTIIGNQYMSTVSDNDCTAEISGEIEFGRNSDTAFYVIENASVDNATGGSCNVSYSISESGSGGPLNINPVSTTYSVGSLGLVSNAYVYGASDVIDAEVFAIEIQGLTTTGSSPADTCFTVYVKQ